jgi:urea transport system permease protein
MACVVAIALFIGTGFAWAAEVPVVEVLSANSTAGPLTLTDVKTLTERLASDDPAVHDQAFHTIIEAGDASLLALLETALADADRATRVAVKPVKDLLKNKLNLGSETDEIRRSAAADLGTSGQLSAVAWLQLAASKEAKPWVRYAMEESAALLQLTRGDSTLKVRAATVLGEMRSQNGLPALKEFVQQLSNDPALGEENQQALRSANAAIEQIELWSFWANIYETVFRGISLSSILLIMSLGLAVVFGLMGVINMAHGELMMVGAYATFVTQELFKAYLPHNMFEAYFLISLPMSFLVAGLCGLILEATVIRFLYGRPLETMLATWGVSLVLIQLARVYFGDLTAVVAPAWLSGGAQVMVGVYLPYNRLFIIGLSILCVMGMYGLLFRTNLGLRVRAVTQNRNMSSCLGIPTRKVDAYTFAFGSGLAGLAGCALTLVGNVEPGLGQNYIVDSFMVVVTGGVGKLAGTIVAALGIGSLNKFLEPSFGAVYGKVLILVLVILFLQRRPSGLFAIKGRHAD